MSTAPVSSSSSTSPENPFTTFRNDFRQLTQSIQSGDLSGAQAAFQALQQSGVTPPANSPLANDLTAIGQALQSGDITGAQQALTSLKSDMTSARQAHHGHHGHHHLHGGANSTSDSTTNIDSSGTTGTTISAIA